MFFGMIGMYLSLSRLLHNHIMVLYLFGFLAHVVPAANLIVACEHVHGHHADGKGDRAYDHFPGVGGHEKAMHSKKPSEHDLCVF